MAFPFGATKFGTYLHWAASQGCTCQHGYSELHGHTIVTITAPSGRSVTVADTQQNEGLLSLTLNYLDRRLGLTSPFPRI